LPTGTRYPSPGARETAATVGGVSERAKPIEEDVEGLAYHPGFVSGDEERELVRTLERLAYAAVTMRGQTARRSVRHFGLGYAYETGALEPTDPLPSELEWLRERCAELIDRAPADLVQILISRYPEGAGIGWHRDAPMFGSKIVGVSLGSPCRMRFQRTVAGTRRVADIDLEPRSAYVLAGKARWSWQHSIPAARALRYSITFRTLRRERSG
jgi:alkylated DNA repair dioxygenase AlkB